MDRVTYIIGSAGQGNRLRLLVVDEDSFCRAFDDLRQHLAILRYSPVLPNLDEVGTALQRRSEVSHQLRALPFGPRVHITALHLLPSVFSSVYNEGLGRGLPVCQIMNLESCSRARNLQCLGSIRNVVRRFAFRRIENPSTGKVGVRGTCLRNSGHDRCEDENKQLRQSV